MVIGIKQLLFFRWSTYVSFICYVIFVFLIRTLSLPLTPNTNSITNNKYTQNSDSFQIKILNSNFNSDIKDRHKSVITKNEYLLDIDEIENINKDKSEILQDVFKRADKDKDNKLDSKELAQWIRLKIIEHITSAVTNNFELFSLIDNNPKNGVISWKEYHTYFLKKRGFSNNYVQNHDERRHKGLGRSIKEQIMRDRASWIEAAKSNPDSLTIEEFLAFTHPESSASNQLALVDEMFDKFDRDGDELLTENEFAVLQTEGNEDETIVVRQDEKERRAEFRTTIDLNGDGFADRKELLRYVAPQSPRHSEHEAEALLSLADNDHDKMLSLDEILIHPDLFLQSKMVDTGRSFHDEF